MVQAWLESPPPQGSPPAPIGLPCLHGRCCTIVVAPTRTEAEQRLAEHERRTHGEH
jgi:hypothetical protein